MKRRLLSFVLAFAMLLSVTPVAVFAADGTGLGLKGTGTETNPYLIENLEDLVKFRDYVDTYRSDGLNQCSGMYFKLTANINLAGINWNPIGSMSGDHGSFKGVFDGNGHTISNLNVQQAGNGLGLFARTAENAEIKNLTLNNVTVKSTDNSNYVSGVIGNAYASTKVTNVHVTGNIDISGRGYIGGIAGHGYVVMDNVSVKGEGTISSTFWCAGGILGYGGEGATNIMNATVEGTGAGLTITSAAGGLGAIVGMAEDNNGTQPISGSNLSAKNVDIKTYTGAYGDAYANYALGYLYGGNPTSKLTGNLSVEDVSVTTSTGEPANIVDAVAINRLKYVSLGASNTNGFGLMGYLPDDLYGNPVNKMNGSVYGYKMEPDMAYPALVAAALQTKTGRAVALEQLAISSMRAEELHVLLDNDYYGDKYTEWRFTAGQNWFNMAHPAGLNGLRAEYQNFVANADVITVDIGANNFGVYASNRIFNNMFDADFTRFDEGTQRDIAKVKGEIDSLLGTYVSDALTPELAGMMEHIVDTMTYALVGFCVNFDASMERIYALNPDATVVVVNIQNLMHDLYATLPGLDQPFAFGEFYGAIVNMANAYIATGSPYSDRYFCAYIGADGQAETFLKDVQDYTGDPADLRTAVTDCFDVYDNDMYAKTRVLQTWMTKYISFVSIVDNKYSVNELLDLNKFSTAIYKDEIEFAGVRLSKFLAAGEAGELALVNPAYQAAYDEYKAMLLTVYDTAATFMQLGANSTVMDLAAAAANFATQGKAVLQTMFAMLEASIVNPGLKIEETPEFQALANNPTAMAIITLGVRSDLGNSFFSHPNENGHEEIKNAILAAVENEIKGDDLVMNELVDAMQFAYDYIRAHYNEIYNNAWNLAKAQGFVDMANGYIDQVVAAINSIDYSALDGKTHLIPTLDALKAEVLGDVEALRALINNPNHPTAGEITALMDELYNDLIALQNVAAQADLDAVAQLITLHKQIMKQYDIAYNQACAYICEQLGQAYDVIVAELTRIVAEQNAAAAELLAKYLGENPADLIQTILEYGYNVDAFINKWSYHAQMLLGPAWNEYGEDITAFVQENIAKLLSSLKAEAGNLSAEATNALLSYIDDLKITENVYAIASQLQNGGMQIGWNTLTELEAIVNGLNDQLIVNAAAAIQALEALAASQDAAAAKAIIDAAIAEIRTTEAERMAAIDAIYADIMAAKAALTTAADAIYDLQSAAQVLGSLVENPAAFNFDSAVEAITTLLNELDAAVATVKAATAQIVTLTNDVSVTAQSICREAAASKTQVMDALYTAETVLQTSGVATETLMRNAYAAAEAYVVGTLNKVNADMVSLLTLCNTELQSAVNNVVTAVNTCLYNATHGEYEIDRFSKYVALGGNAAYADELAALLGLSDRYVKMALTDNYLAEVAGADLVTVKFDNGEFLTFAHNQVMGMAAELITGNEDLMEYMNNSLYGDLIKEYVGQYIDLNAKAQVLDWNAYLDARAQGVLKETLANVKTLMLEDGIPEVYAFDIGAILTEMLKPLKPDLVLDIPVADLAVAAIENALYGYVRFANEFTSVLNTIHAVSPEAEVVVTGIQNPVIGLPLNVPGTEVNVGEYAEYVQYVVDALNVHLYAYALANDNTTYVGGNTAADILNALTVTKAPLLGDANNDGVVDSIDAAMVLQYDIGMIQANAINLAVSDVNGDGAVNSIDAAMILQYDIGMIQQFPAAIH